MLKEVERKIGMTVEEYIQKTDEYNKTIKSEDDKPHSIIDISKLTNEETKVLVDRIRQLTENK